jgi:hypothetical protein
MASLTDCEENSRSNVAGADVIALVYVDIVDGDWKFCSYNSGITDYQPLTTQIEHAADKVQGAQVGTTS